MSNFGSPKSVTGNVSWNDGSAKAEASSHPQERTTGPLTGKDVSQQAAPRVSQGSSSSRKSASAFRTISEVADELDVQQHVLRFWETKFSQVRPLKRGGGRRYYRPEDLALLKKIHNLLYTQGYTIKGVQKLLKEQGKKGLLEQDTVETAPVAAANAEAEAVRQGLSASQRSLLQSTLGELKALRAMISND